LTVDKSIVNQSTLAKALGLSRQMVSKLKRQGMPVHSLQAAQAWRDARVNPARAKPVIAPPAPQSKASDGGETFEQALLRRMVADANLTEMRHASERDSLIGVAAVRAVIVAEHAQLARAAAQLVQRLVPQLVPLADAAEVQTLLDAEIHAFLDREAHR
jgi:phage terminase Nu1 subunit (DNA packaging protein)